MAAEIRWTEEQLMAINITDKNLLVSASAGSGKTAVLVERIIRMVKNRTIQTDEILAITFTKAAAGELKERIRTSLTQQIALSKKADKEYFSEQIEKLDRAAISTLHSFCYSVIKKYYHLIGLDPQVKIMRDEEKAILYSDCINMLFEEYYENDDNFFIEFIDTFSYANDDENIKETIISSYEQLRNIADYEKVIKEFAESYPCDEESLSLSSAAKFVTEKCAGIISEARAKYVSALNIARGEDDEKRSVSSKLEDIISVIDLYEQKRLESFRAFADIIHSTPLPRPSVKKIGRLEEINYYRDSGRDIIGELKTFVPFDFETTLYYTTQMQPYVMKYTEVLMRFEELLEARKREKKMVDYSDLEHMCLKILSDENAAEEVRSSFGQVLVDEYQDINGVQEAIIQKVSSGDDLFMVGDIKQSIYRFRQADPGIFYDKYVRFRASSDEDKNKLVYLSRNYRSSKVIIDFVNMVFSEVMTKKTGGVDYYPDEVMNPVHPVLIDEPVHMRIVDCREVKSDEDIEDNREAEAMYVASLIRNEILQKTYTDHSGAPLRFRPSDIAVIDRSMKAKAAYFLSAFESCGLKANIVDDSKFFDAYEVTLTINLLRVIDNELNDIALLSVMRSFLYNFDEDDITLIRSEYPDKMYYHEAVAEYVISGKDAGIRDKLEGMYSEIRRYRKLSRHTSIRDLIEMIYEEKYVFPFVSAMSDGDKRIENLNELMNIASDYESSHVKGLYDFIIYADRCKEKMKRKPAAEDAEGVKLMTTHSSKGLQFEVVIVTGCATQIKNDKHPSGIFIDKNFGICPKFTDMKLGYKTDTLALTAKKRNSALENKAEEMRILYVAATRAKKLLYLTAAVDRQDVLSKVYTEKLGEHELSGMNDYLSWIRYAADMNPEVAEKIFDIKIVDAAQAGEMTRKRAARNIFEDLSADEETVTAIRKNYEYEYPYHSSMIPTKLSVSALKDQENISSDKLIERKSIREELSDKLSKAQAAKRGNMIHKIMELADTSLLKSGDVEKAIDEAVRQGKIAAEDVTEEDRRMITEFFGSDIGKMMINSSSLHREQPFILKEKAKDINPLWEKSEDEILVQGIIDCWFEYGGEVYVVDFKTDRIKSNEHLLSLNEKYSTQLYYYKKALSLSLGREIKAAYICYLRKNIAFSV
ncbi:MAG: helicase-exonuclease AddAB subunit AddA [Eubacteriaceae bacterium]|nr:helicase-exonuclease AddAB subunit AddA [Eubacteriaceae bacterium]